MTDDDRHVCRVDHKRIMHKLEGMFDQWDGSPAAQVPQKVGPDERSMIRGTDSRQHQTPRSEEHTSELQSLAYLVCRLLLEKKKTNSTSTAPEHHTPPNLQ